MNRTKNLSYSVQFEVNTYFLSKYILIVVAVSTFAVVRINGDRRRHTAICSGNKCRGVFTCGRKFLRGALRHRSCACANACPLRIAWAPGACPPAQSGTAPLGWELRNRTSRSSHACIDTDADRYRSSFPPTKRRQSSAPRPWPARPAASMSAASPSSASNIPSSCHREIYGRYGGGVGR